MSANQITLAAYTANSWEHALAVLRVLGPAEKAGIRVLQGNNGEAFRPEKVADANLVLIQRDFPRYQQAYEEVMRQARHLGVPVVFDLDDLLLELPPDHPDRAIHYYTEALAPMLHTLVTADAVTASTPMLAEYLRDFNPRVWVLPNYLNDDLWPLRPPREPANDLPVIVGYMGGDSHRPDLAAVAPALLALAQRFGERVRFRFWGGAPPPELLALPGAEWIELNLAYAEYAAYLHSQRVDIVIAPLQDNLFNRCKSTVKALEYSALGAPGVYSQIAPYQQVITSGENGFLAASLNDWQTYLARLIESPSLRHEMSARAQATLRTDWLLSRHAREWTRAYQEILALPSRPEEPERHGRVSRLMLRYQLEAQQMWRDQLASLEVAMREQNAQLQSLRQEQAAFEASPTGRMVRALAQIRQALAPTGSARERVLSWIKGLSRQ